MKINSQFLIIIIVIVLNYVFCPLIISSDSLCDIQKRKLVRFISNELPQIARLFQHCINVICIP